MERETRLEKQLNYLKSEKIDVVYARSIRSDTQKIFPSLSYYLPLNFVIKYKNPLIHGTMFAKKNVIEKVGCYDENFIYSQDYKLAYDLIKSGFKLRIMRNVLYNSNFINNISTNKKKEQKYYANCKKRNKAKTDSMKIFINDAKEDWIVDRFKKNFQSTIKKYLPMKLKMQISYG